MIKIQARIQSFALVSMICYLTISYMSTDLMARTPFIQSIIEILPFPKQNYIAINNSDVICRLVPNNQSDRPVLFCHYKNTHPNKINSYVLWIASLDEQGKVKRDTLRSGHRDLNLQEPIRLLAVMDNSAIFQDQHSLQSTPIAFPTVYSPWGQSLSYVNDLRMLTNGKGWLAYASLPASPAKNYQHPFILYWLEDAKINDQVPFAEFSPNIQKTGELTSYDIGSLVASKRMQTNILLSNIPEIMGNLENIKVLLGQDETVFLQGTIQIRSSIDGERQMVEKEFNGKDVYLCWNQSEQQGNLNITNQQAIELIGTLPEKGFVTASFKGQDKENILLQWITSDCQIQQQEIRFPAMEAKLGQFGYGKISYHPIALLPVLDNQIGILHWIVNAGYLSPCDDKEMGECLINPQIRLAVSIFQQNREVEVTIPLRTFEFTNLQYEKILPMAEADNLSISDFLAENIKKIQVSAAILNSQKWIIAVYVPETMQTWLPLQSQLILLNP